ncbi:unnamed protein product, partial [Didymodactylos carnosus]
RAAELASFPISVYFRKRIGGQQKEGKEENQNSTNNEYQQLQTSSENITDELNVKSASSAVNNHNNNNSNSNNNNNNNQNSAVVSSSGVNANSSCTTDIVGIDENEDDTNSQMKFDDTDSISVVPYTVKRYTGRSWHVSPEMTVDETAQQNNESICK